MILNRCHASSAVELLKIITTEFEHYYIDKLRSIASNCTSTYMHEKFDKLAKKISDEIQFDGDSEVRFKIILE